MGVCDFPLMDKVCGAVDFATNPAGTVTDGIGAWIAKSMGELAASAADLAAKAVNETTAIDLNAGWFRDNYELLLPIGLALTVGIFCIQLMTAAWRRDERALAQAAFGTMTGVLFSFSAIAFTTVAITVVDALSDGLFHAANTSVDDAIRRVVKVNQLGAMYGLGWGVPALVALGCAIGAFLYWGVMVARKVGVLIMVSLAVFAGAAWRLGGRQAVAARLDRGHRHPGRLQAPDDGGLPDRRLRHGQERRERRDGRPVRRDGGHRRDGPRAALPVRDVQVRALGQRRRRPRRPAPHRRRRRWRSPPGRRRPRPPWRCRRAPALPLPRARTRSPVRAPMASPPASIPLGGNLSKEDIDAGPPKQQTRFRYGEDPNATGDKGRALIQRPGIPPLITRPGADEAEGSGVLVTGATGSSDYLVGASAPGGSMTSLPPVGPATAPPPPAGPSATGSPTPTNWVFPNQPPSGS